jgi:hypothetical protein
MSDLHYYQYAFAQSDCRVQAACPGVDPRFEVELLCEGPIAAAVSRVGLDQFDPSRLEGTTPEDVAWLSQIATRHNDIICQLAKDGAVLPLRMGAIFRSRESLKAMLNRCQRTVAGFLQQFGNRQEWGVKLFWNKPCSETMEAHRGPPAPHCVAPARSGKEYLRHKKVEIDTRRATRAEVQHTIHVVEQRLAGEAEEYCRVRVLPTSLTGRGEKMLYNAAFLLASSAHDRWLEAIRRVRQEVCHNDLLLQVSGPWPPYHFCPSLEL